MTSRSIKMPTGPAAVASQVPGGSATSTGLASGRGVRQARLGVVDKARAYVVLTKPGIVLELLVIAVPAMILAQGGWPELDLIALVLLGGALTGGGAQVINQWYDRAIDAVMLRTAQRPIPAGKIAPRHALYWGLLLSIVGGLQLLLTVNWLAALLALATIAFYILVYTIWLKRSTVHNTVIGGVAGAAPPLVGWAAVTGGLDVGALGLFLIVFLWQPPHFWALALRYKDEYAKAGIPMLPVVRGEEATHRQTLIYAVLLAVSSLLLYATGDLGEIYLGVALALGLAFVAQAWRLTRRAIPPMRLFFFSLFYLTTLFGAVALDVLVG